MVKDRIEFNQKIRQGKPIIRGTRVPVEVVLGALAGGMSFAEVEKEYGITEGDIRAAIEYAASIVSHEEVYPISSVSKK